MIRGTDLLSKQSFKDIDNLSTASIEEEQINKMKMAMLRVRVDFAHDEEVRFLKAIISESRKYPLIERDFSPYYVTVNQSEKARCPYCRTIVRNEKQALRIAKGIR